MDILSKNWIILWDLRKWSFEIVDIWSTKIGFFWKIGCLAGKVEKFTILNKIIFYKISCSARKLAKLTICNRVDIWSTKVDILEFFEKWIFSFYFGNIEDQRTTNIQIRANGSLEQKIKNINSFWKSIKLSRWFLFWRLVILPTMTSSVSIMILPVIGTSSVHLNRVRT